MGKVKKRSCPRMPCRSFECWCNFHSWRIWLAGFILSTVAQIIYFICFLIFIKYYREPNIKIWSDLMMPYKGGFSSNFIFYSWLGSFFLAVIFAGIYKWLHGCFCGQGVERGLCFGWLLFLVKTLPFCLFSFLLFNLPAGLIVLWLVENFLVDLIDGLILAAIIRED